MERKSEPVEIQPTFVINNSQVTQILTRSIEYTTSKSEFYETTKEEQYGVKGKSHKIKNAPNFTKLCFRLVSLSIWAVQARKG